MQRSDVVLAELDTFLQAQDCSQSRIILAVASETSSLLPCCKQSLGRHLCLIVKHDHLLLTLSDSTGFKNAQISKLWSASHWKTDGCRIYWKDAHLVCVRKYRPSQLTLPTARRGRSLLADSPGLCLPPFQTPPMLQSSKSSSL
jgi:hypothetical protein